MKKLITALFVLISIAVQGQMKVSIDKFTKEKRVVSNYVTLKMKFNGLIQINYRAVGNYYFLSIYGTVDECVVGVTDPLTFLFEDSTTASVYPTSIQTYNVNFGSNNTYDHQYRMPSDILDMLRTKKVVSIRRVGSRNLYDYDLKDKRSEQLLKLSAEFYNEVNKP